MFLVLGEYCQVDANCWLKDNTFGSCVRGRCICKFDKQVPTEDGLSCIDSKDLGETCNSQAECGAVQNAICSITCKCGARYISSQQRDRCLKGILLSLATSLSTCQRNLVLVFFFFIHITVLLFKFYRIDNSMLVV